jgi:DNA-binding NarL/FixJ family response regulator
MQPDMEIVGAADSGAEGFSMFRDLKPDVTLVDLRLRDITGFDLIRNILALAPSARTIVLTSFEGDVDIQRAFAAGARGYVVKGMVREELLHAIRAVHAGKQHVPSAIAAKLVDHLASEKLTQRELDVLKEVARGKRNKEIGATLSIAEDTVKMHVKSILMKLGVNDRTEAVTIALRRGIIHLH